MCFADASLSELFQAAKNCVLGNPDRQQLIKNLEEIWTTEQNPNNVLPCLSVRTALDLFLRVIDLPSGSEVIMSAINIPDICHVLHHHKLKIVPLDVDMETMAPKLSLLENLITNRTKLLLVAHIYGKTFDVGPYIEIAHKHNIMVIEDRAEAFLGFEQIGHPEADLTLFSFGVIKFCTAFGGAIAKIKDKDLYDRMNSFYKTYPIQSHSEYFKKVLKYACIALTLNLGITTKFNLTCIWWFGVDFKRHVIGLLRGFPNQLIYRLRHQPCTALIQTLERRMTNFDPSEIAMTTSKGEYVSERLGEKVTQLGNKAEVKSYWLYPVVVVSINYPAQFIGKHLH